jgi:DNA polymerase (family 10)
MRNEEIAAALEELAELLALRGDNPFRIRAYQRAALVVRSHGRALAEAGSIEELDGLPGIGEDLAGKIIELSPQGICACWSACADRFPPACENCCNCRVSRQPACARCTVH